MSDHDATLTIATPDGPMDAYVAFPEAARAPGVLVIQEAFGVNEHVRDVCRRFAAAGYVALAPELFHRTGRGVDLPYGDFAKVVPHFSPLTNAGIEVDLRAALATLSEHPRCNGSVGVVGFCLGGFVAFLAACRLPIQSAVSFYGGGIVRSRTGLALWPLIGEVAGIDAPILLLFGENDAGIPPGDVETIRGRLEALGKRHEIVVYPEAGHAFFCDARPSYRPAAAEEAWRRTLEWLDATLIR